MNLTGTLDNAGHNVWPWTPRPARGTWSGGTIKGGTLTRSGGAELVFTASGGTLDGVTAASDLDLDEQRRQRLRQGRSDARQRHRAAGQCGRHDLRLPVLPRDAGPGGHGDGALRQERQQRHLRDSWYGATLTIGSGITVRGAAAPSARRQ